MLLPIIMILVCVLLGGGTLLFLKFSERRKKAKSRDKEELAQMTDASVLVVRQDTVLAKDINDAIDILNNTRGKVIGCILNGTASQSTGGNSHYRYGGHYGKRA